MAKLKKTVTALFAVLFTACLFLGAYFFLFQKNRLAAYAETVTIGSDDAGDYLNIEDGVLRGFKSGANLPEGDYVLEIPEGVTSIAGNAFNAENNNMVGIVLPESLAAIENNAFVNLDKLVEVWNKSNIELSAGDNHASGITSRALNVCGKNSDYKEPSRLTTDDGYVFVYDSQASKWALVGYEGNSAELTLPAKVTVEEGSEYPEGVYDISMHAFRANTVITNVTIPEGVEIISDYAFAACTGLESVSLPQSLKEIRSSAFYNCSKLSSIEWGGVSTIGNSAFSGCSALTALDLPASLVSIGQSSFANCTGVTRLTFADKSKLETIERYAFSNCTGLGKSVELPESLKSMYIRAFYGCDNISFVYINSDVTFNNRSVGVEEGYFASNTVIVFKDSATYQKAVAQNNLSSAHRNTTYLIDIVTYEESKPITDGTSQRLYGYNYDFVKINSGIDKGTWATDSSLTNSLAVQNGAEGYKSTVWYKTASLEGTANNVADVAYVNGLLKTSVDKIEIYAHKAVSRPENILSGWTYDENTVLQTSGVLGYFGGQMNINVAGMKAGAITYKNTSGRTETIRNISNAGVYTVNVALDEKYGEWVSPAVFTIDITKQAIDLNNVEYYGEQFWTSNGSALLNATTTTLYIYGGVPYLTRQENLGEETIVYVKTSYLSFNGAEQVINVSTNNNKYFTVNNEQGNRATATGSYTARAVITATNNYSFKLDSTQEAAERGHFVEINSDGTASLTKNWYIIKLPNRVLISGTDSEYNITDWTFGDSSVEVPLPVLEKGNPANGNYDDIFTFKLVKDGLTVGGANTTFRLSAFTNYVNWTMPAGQYELQVSVSNVTEGQEVIEGFSATFRFSVAKAKLAVEETGDKTPSYIRPVTDVAGFFANSLTVGYVGLDEFNEYWEDNAACFWGVNKDVYYSENCSFTYNLARMYSSVYYEIGAAEMVEKIAADTFTVYYLISLANHDFADIADRYSYYYTVIGYTEISAPDVDSAVYTGSKITPQIYDTAEYSVSVPENILDAKDYTISLTLNETAHYKWADKEYGVAATDVKFTVDKAANGWFTNINLIRWTWQSYEKTTNRFIAAPDFGTAQDVEYRIYDKNHKLIKIDGKEYFKLDADGYVSNGVATALNGFNADQYYLLATVKEAANWYGINTAVDNESVVSANAIEFNVAKATNTWRNSPNVISWRWGEFDKDVNLISAVPAFGGQARFAITTDAEGKKPVNGLENFTTENGKVSDIVMKILDKQLSTKQSYYLISKVSDSTNYTGLESSLEFNVFIMNNYWKNVPEIRGWSEGRYDATLNAVKAEALSGDVVITITDLDGNVIKESDIAGLGIGEYILTAKVEGTDNYTSLENSVHFFVVEDSVGMSGIIAAAIVFACFDVICAGFCIALVFIRKKKIEDRFRRMIKSELHKGE